MMRSRPVSVLSAPLRVSSAPAHNPVERPSLGVSSRSLSPVPLTKGMFFEDYGKGTKNLDQVDRPSFLNDTTFMQAPESYNESRRLKAEAKISSAPQWERTDLFHSLLCQLCKTCNTAGASVSLVNARYQIVKHQIGLGLVKCTRQVSLDAHSILSLDSFCILDTYEDWRLKDNPLVRGPPSIRYYVSVPLLTKGNYAVGAVSVFDSFPRTHPDDNAIQALKQTALNLLTLLEGGSIDLNVSQLCKPSNSDPYSSTMALFAKFGRATCWDNDNKVIYTGSSNPYQDHTELRFSRYYHPYDDIVDLHVWKAMLPFKNLRVASNFLARLLVNSHFYDVVYILELKASYPACIHGGDIPKQMEFPLKDFKHLDRVEIIGDQYVRFNILGAHGDSEGVDSHWEKELHLEAFQSERGLLYNTADETATFKSGMCLPFYQSPKKVVRRSKRPASNPTDADIYIRHGGYLIGCFSKENKKITREEIGYVYGCASILRRMYLG